MNNVIITGSSNGFGYLSAIAFAEQGYRVWATMRNAAGSNREPKELLEAAAGDIRVLDMDVADDASVDAAIAKVQPEARREVLDDYGPLSDVPAGMLAYFAEFFTTDAAPDNGLVVDAYLALAAAEPGQRPMRTHVGIEHGVPELNRLSQPIQDNVVNELGLTAVLAHAGNAEGPHG